MRCGFLGGACVGTSKKKPAYRRDFNELLHSPDMAVYLEPERKIDARDWKVLDRLQAYIQQDPYFEPLNDPSAGYDIPAGIHVSPKDINDIDVPFAMESTTRRFRVYYDTPDQKAFKGGAEIRIEYPKPTSHGHAKPFKQVVKLGLAATVEDPTFHRIEISGRISEPIPSFETCDLDENKRLSTFLKEYFDPKSMVPLQLLTTVRTRIWCRPGGDQNTIVEFGFDRGSGLTIDGFRYPLMQLEPEIIKGDPAILDEISQRIQKRFKAAVSPNFTSKPSPGFNHLASVLKGNKAAVAYLGELPRNSFGIIKSSECPALYRR